MIIYNLFPTIAGKINEWENYLDDIKNMEFDYIYINPIFETGYSKSLYAPKDFYNINQDMVDIFSDESPEEQLKNFIKKSHEKGIKIILELILTHTAMDSTLLMNNPEWYKYDNQNHLKNFSFKDNERWLEWGDLIEIDNENSEDKENLWKYWIKLMKYYIDFGFDGFKIEAAYKLPLELLKKIINEGKIDNNDIVFIADNLGAGFHEMIDLAQAGFDYMFTSLKWWDFNATWLLEQHYELKEIVKLISFPESYNTERVAEKYNKNPNASKAWYAVSALFNTGVMIPIGYEYCCNRKIDMLPAFDFISYDNQDKGIKNYIKIINNIKKQYKVFKEETDVYIIDSANSNIFMYKKMTKDKEQEALIIMNKNYSSKEKLQLNNFKNIITKQNIKDISPESIGIEFGNDIYFELNPGEIKIILGTN